MLAGWSGYRVAEVHSLLMDVVKDGLPTYLSVSSFTITAGFVNGISFLRY